MSGMTHSRFIHLILFFFLVPSEGIFAMQMHIPSRFRSGDEALLAINNYESSICRETILKIKYKDIKILSEVSSFSEEFGEITRLQFSAMDLDKNPVSGHFICWKSTNSERGFTIYYDWE